MVMMISRVVVSYLPIPRRLRLYTCQVWPAASATQEGVVSEPTIQHEAAEFDAPENEDRSSVPGAADSVATEMSGIQGPSVQGVSSFIVMHSSSSGHVANPLPEPDGCIQPLKALAEVSPDPYLLPPDLELEWSPIDLMNDTQVTTSKHHMHVIDLHNLAG